MHLAELKGGRSATASAHRYAPLARSQRNIHSIWLNRAFAWCCLRERALQTLGPLLPSGLTPVPAVPRSAKRGAAIFAGRVVRNPQRPSLRSRSTTMASAVRSAGECSDLARCRADASACRHNNNCLKMHMMLGVGCQLGGGWSRGGDLMPNPPASPFASPASTSPLGGALSATAH